MAFGTGRSALTGPWLASVCPLRPPVAVAVAVKSGFILSMAVSLECPSPARRSGGEAWLARDQLDEVAVEGGGGLNPWGGDARPARALPQRPLARRGNRAD